MYDIQVGDICFRCEKDSFIEAFTVDKICARTYFSCDRRSYRRDLFDLTGLGVEVDTARSLLFYDHEDGLDRLGNALNEGDLVLFNYHRRFKLGRIVGLTKQKAHIEFEEPHRRGDPETIECDRFIAETVSLTACGVREEDARSEILLW